MDSGHCAWSFDAPPSPSSKGDGVEQMLASLETILDAGLQQMGEPPHPGSERMYSYNDWQGSALDGQVAVPMPQKPITFRVTAIPDDQLTFVNPRDLILAAPSSGAPLSRLEPAQTLHSDTALPQETLRADGALYGSQVTEQWCSEGPLKDSTFSQSAFEGKAPEQDPAPVFSATNDMQQSGKSIDPNYIPSSAPPFTMLSEPPHQSSHGSCGFPTAEFSNAEFSTDFGGNWTDGDYDEVVDSSVGTHADINNQTQTSIVASTPSFGTLQDSYSQLPLAGTASHPHSQHRYAAVDSKPLLRSVLESGLRNYTGFMDVGATAPNPQIFPLLQSASADYPPSKPTKRRRLDENSNTSVLTGPIEQFQDAPIDNTHTASLSTSSFNFNADEQRRFASNASDLTQKLPSYHTMHPSPSAGGAENVSVTSLAEASKAPRSSSSVRANPYPNLQTARPSTNFAAPQNQQPNAHRYPPQLPKTYVATAQITPQSVAPSGRITEEGKRRYHLFVRKLAMLGIQWPPSGANALPYDTVGSQTLHMPALTRVEAPNTEAFSTGALDDKAFAYKQPAPATPPGPFQRRLAPVAPLHTGAPFPSTTNSVTSVPRSQPPQSSTTKGTKRQRLSTESDSPMFISKKERGYILPVGWSKVETPEDFARKSD